jgi:hypothetical protein
MLKENAIYHWQSALTGEVCKNLGEVFKNFLADLKHYQILNLLWKYSRKGF